MIFQQNTVKFFLPSGDGKLLEEVSFRCSNIPTGLLLPCAMYISGRFLRDSAWKRPVLIGKITVSDRILWDPVAGIIDLVDCLEIQYNC